MKKKLFSIALVLTLLVALFAALTLTASAADVVDSGTCGDDLTWTLDSDGVLTISGTGAMPDYEWDASPWYNNRDRITSLVIESGVTSIDSYAFYDCSSLTSVDIPGSVTTIGDGAFSGCSSLTSIDLPDSVTSIGSAAFEYCSSLTSIDIPDGVTSIGDGTFWYCTGLISVDVPDGVTSIGQFAFSSSGLTSIDLPGSVTTIGNYAFSDCTSLTSIDIPNSVTSIGGSAFIDCTSLTSVNMGYRITTISNWAFHGCSSLVSVEIPLNVTTIGSGAFSDCSGLTSVAIGIRMTTIKENAFAGCTGLTAVYYQNSPEQWAQITIGDGNTPLTSAKLLRSGGTCGDNVTWGLDHSGVLTISGTGGIFFSTQSWLLYCNDITSVMIESGVTGIGTYAFSDCTSLTSIHIPESVASVDRYAFHGCAELTEVTFLGDAPSFGDGAFYGVTATVYYPGDNATWTDEVKQNYGGTLTWVKSGYDLTITAQPTDQSAPSGYVYFTVVAEGDELTYQWQWSADGESWGNTTLTGYNTNQLRVGVSSVTNGRQYRCVITDKYGSTVTSDAAKLIRSV